MSEQRYETLAEFWPYYLSEHLSPLNRALHAVGSLGGLAWLGLAVAWGQPWLALAGLVNGYAFAWVGHFVVERNRPATFHYPFKSFVCDWIMLAYVLTGRIGREVEKLREGRVLSEAEEGAVG